MGGVLKDWDGRHYEKYSGHQQEWGGSLIRELEISGSERILDLGCGNGLVTRQLADLVPNGEVVGIDSSPQMLEVALEKCSKNMRVELLDINCLSYDQEFDIVFSNATLHWIHDHSMLWRNIYRALKPGGCVRVQFAADGNCPNLTETLHRQLKRPQYQREFEGFRWPWYNPTREAYEHLLNEVPFSRMKVWTERKERIFNKEELIGFIDNPGLIPFMKGLESPVLREQLRRDVIEEMLTLTRKADGSFVEDFCRMNVYAKKGDR